MKTLRQMPWPPTRRTIRTLLVTAARPASVPGRWGKHERPEENVLSVRVASSKRSWPYLAATAVPWLLLAGQRRITRLEKLTSHPRGLSGDYRFLSGGKWRMELSSGCLFALIVKTFRITELTLVRLPEMPVSPNDDGGQ